MRRKIFSSFTIRKRLPIRVFGSTIYQTIRIPVDPVLGTVFMIAEYFLEKFSRPAPPDRQIDTNNEGE